MSYKLRILSLGAGVQSTTLYLMAERGLIEPFHCAIFADTGCDPQYVYDLIGDLQRIGTIPILVTSYGNVYEDTWENYNGMLLKKRSTIVSGFTPHKWDSRTWIAAGGGGSRQEREHARRFAAGPR